MWCVDDVGPKRYQRLCDAFGSPAGVLAAGPQEAARALRAPALFAKWRATWPRDGAADALRARLESVELRVVPRESDRFPRALAEVEGLPFLFARGDVGALGAPMAALVGSRTARPADIRLTESVTGWCVERGWGIVSGGALGIDAAAHEAALRRSVPTVVVQPAGLEDPAPRSLHGLFDRVCEAGGCLVSEHPPWRRPTPLLFARRNRLISGLSAFVVVVRAAASSGALLTADWARKQGRPVFAVPGDPTEALVQGCLDEIERGAQVLTSPARLPEPPVTTPRRESDAHRAEPAEASGSALADSAVARFLRKEGESSLEWLAAALGWPARQVIVEVTRLRLCGAVEETAPNRFRLLSRRRAT